MQKLTEKTIDHYVLIMNVNPESQVLNEEAIFDAVASTFQKELAELARGITDIVPEINLPPAYVNALKANLYVAVRGYGTLKRKLGGMVFNHPYQAAQIAAESYRDLGLTDQDTFLVSLLVALHHDRIEDRTEQRIKKEFKSIEAEVRQKVLSQRVPHRGRTFDAAKIFEIFSQVGEEYKLPSPSKIEDINQYTIDFREAYQRNSFRERLRQGKGDPSLMNVYVRLAEQYHQRLDAALAKKERKYHREERNIFAQELKASLAVADTILKRSGTFHPRCIRTRVETAVHHMTRSGSEEYYESVRRVVQPGHLDSILGKSHDRRANNRTLDRRKRENIRYCEYDPNPEKRMTGRELKKKLVIKGERLDLVSILETPFEDLAIDNFVSSLYALTAENYRYQRAEAIQDRRRGNRKAPRTHLRPHNKLYQLYKNVILVTSTRRKFNSDLPREINYENTRLLEDTLEVAKDIVEETFSCYCKPQSPNFKLQDAQAVYRSMKEYEQQGGFAHVTHEADVPVGSSFMFDGLFKLYFHQRVKGTGKLNGTLLRNKQKLFAAALVFHRLAELYLNDPHFYVGGITYKGLTAAKPVFGN